MTMLHENTVEWKDRTYQQRNSNYIKEPIKTFRSICYIKLKIHEMGLITEWIDTTVSEPKDRTTKVIKYEEQKKMGGKKTNKASGTCETISKSLTFVLLQSKKKKRKTLGQ